MTDFRFYVVSIAAIFIALAAGILLGSGPLRMALVEDLDSQIEILQDSRDDLQLDLTAERERNARYDDFLDAAEGWMLEGRLEGVSVTIVTVYDPADSDVAAVRDRIASAGASVGEEVDLGDVWTDEEQSTFRTALAQQLRESVAPLADIESPDGVLNRALVAMVVPGTLLDVDDSDPTGVVTDIMVRAELVSGPASQASDVIVVVSGTGAASVPARERSHAIVNETLLAIAQHRPVVVATGPARDADLPTQIQAESRLQTVLTTVRGAYSNDGTFAVALAIVTALDGRVGHYGGGASDGLLPQP